MRKALLAIVAVFAMAIQAHADDLPLQVTDGFRMKQGMLYKWSNPDGGVENMTLFEIVRTVPQEGWSKGANALWSGWSLDAGPAWDSNEFNTAAVMLGRKFGTLGDYLPLEFPLKDKLEITVYPLGIFVEDPLDKPSTHGASGLSIFEIKATF